MTTTTQTTAQRLAELIRTKHAPPAADVSPLFAGRRTALTGGIPLLPVRHLVVEPTAEPIFWSVLNDLGASWLGVEPTGRDVVEGRVLGDDEPGPVDPRIAVAS